MSRRSSFPRPHSCRITVRRIWIFNEISVKFQWNLLGGDSLREPEGPTVENLFDRSGISFLGSVGASPSTWIFKLKNSPGGGDIALLKEGNLQIQNFHRNFHGISTKIDEISLKIRGDRRIFGTRMDQRKWVEDRIGYFSAKGKNRLRISRRTSLSQDSEPDFAIERADRIGYSEERYLHEKRNPIDCDSILVGWSIEFIEGNNQSESDRW